MAMQLIVCVWFDVLGDGSSTSCNIDLTTDAVSFAAGISEQFTPNGGEIIERTISENFKITSKNPPNGVYASVSDLSGTTVSSTVSGTILTSTFSSAIASGTVCRVAVELTFPA